MMKPREAALGPRTKLRVIVIGSAILMLCCVCLPAQALAATDPHAFDPGLSLTGDCSVSTLDPVPDPGPCPGTPGVDHPTNPFSGPKAVTTDFYGNIYVSSPTLEEESPKARIDVFDSSGHFITEVPDEAAPGALAVDSKGNLYVANGYRAAEGSLLRYSPCLPYEPATGEIDYCNPPTVLVATEADGNGLAINPLNDHLFRKRISQITEYKSAAEGNEEVGSFGGGQLQEEPTGIAIDAARGRIYATTWIGTPGNITKAVRVFELAPPHNLLFTLEESDVPGGVIQSAFLSVAADEGTGHFFLYDGEGAKKVYEFDEDGTWVATIEHGFQYVPRSMIAVDNGKFSPNGALNDPKGGRYLFVPSNLGGVGHSYAFGPSTICPPVVESVSFSNVGEAEAELEASIEPCSLETHYVFEYLTQQQFEANGGTFSGAQIAGEGEIPAGKTPIAVAAAAEGLAPGTRYRFRVVAENAKGPDVGEGEFATFPAAEAVPPCPNEALRGGFSALLPDCRAYELVTPPSTNARSPLGLTHNGSFFATRKASPQGGTVSFVIEGGLIPGSEGTGSLFGDPYLSTRGEGGWSTAIAGPSGSESAVLKPGGNSTDQGYSFWETGGPRGTAVIEEPTSYVRYPDGHSALVGRGTIGNDPQAKGQLISDGGAHIIFWVVSEIEGHKGPAIQLEPNAPPSGTWAIYDRTADEVTHVISLLPGDETPKAGEDAFYEGASLDGRGVAFKIGTTLYLRHDNEETYEIGDGVTFAGVAEGGARIFYLEGGRLWRFDVASGARTDFSSGAVTPVNVSADGSTAYFVSTKALTTAPNPNGAKAVNGEENLYRSREGAISFVATVTERDVAGESNGNEVVEGLGLWTKAVAPTPEGAAGRFAIDPSRTTPDGSVLLFESRAPLSGYDPGGNAEVYRYDAAGNTLKCLSCNPTLAPASSDASLQSISAGLGDPQPLTSYGLANNLRADGNRAFFQSNEALVPADVDGLQDVYEWEAQGVGSCTRPGGCLYLISSGHSLRIDYLYGASDTGDDVFFRTSDVLLPRDAEETPSIYDARVGGGFPEPVEEGCQGEGCRPGVSPAPALELPAQPALGADDNVPRKRCPKGKRKARRHGKVVCVKKKRRHHHHKHHKKAGKSKGAGK
jgi:hypothetical protein